MNNNTCAVSSGKYLRSRFNFAMINYSFFVISVSLRKIHFIKYQQDLIHI